MIDLHCHILPGLDDGPGSIEESIVMARIAHRDGITKIVATPHVGDGRLDRDRIRHSVNELNSRLTAEGIPVEILPGADVNITLDLGLFRNHTISDSNYVLVEFPHTHIPGNAREIMFRLKAGGLVPILTHPERNAAAIRDPSSVLSLAEEGTLLQITADSLSGTFGDDIKACALYLLRRGVVGFIATDAHSSDYRRPVLSEGLEVAKGILGAKAAMALVLGNPNAVVNGLPLDD